MALTLGSAAHAHARKSTVIIRSVIIRFYGLHWPHTRVRVRFAIIIRFYGLHWAHTHTRVRSVIIRFYWLHWAHTHTLEKVPLLLGCYY